MSDHKDIDIIKELLPAIDGRNYTFFSDLPKFQTKSGQDDPNKGVDFVPLLRWASAVGSEQVDFTEARRQGRTKGDGKGKWPSSVSDSPMLTEYYVMSVNDLVNKHFWEMIKYPELLYKLFALAGCGEKVNHVWIKGPAKKKHSKVFDMLKELYSTASDDEITMMYKMNTKDDFIEIAKMLGYQDEQIKEITKELAKNDSN